MVTGTFAYPMQRPYGPTATWPTTCHQPHGSFHRVPNQMGFNYPSANAYTPLQRTPHIPPEVSGYVRSQGKAQDDYAGRYLEYSLQARNIDVNAAPPFEPVTAGAAYANHGVVKINNIPFTVSAAEITQFIIRYTGPSPVTSMLKKHENGYPIHIIMEKPTGKTMDCFVEFPTPAAALECVRRFEYAAGGQGPGSGPPLYGPASGFGGGLGGGRTKLGTRNVSLDLSHQKELMEAVFPRARLVDFSAATGEPSIRGNAEGLQEGWSEGFRGYFTLEEIYGITRFAECPGRSPFVLKAHQRVYESMISTLYKFPWPSTTTYTIAARNALFEAAHRQLNILSRKVGLPSPVSDYSSSSLTSYGSYSSKSLVPFNSYENKFNQPSHNREVGLSQALLLDLLFASLNVPSFSPLQQLHLTEAAGTYGLGVTSMLSPFSATWPFQTLQPDPSTLQHIIRFWLELFDTGFDVMEEDGEKTSYEDYIMFSRNSIGFIIGEWTRVGVELPFSDAVKVETAAMMVYVARGREVWARERGIEVTDWDVDRLDDLMEKLAGEKNASEGATTSVEDQFGSLDVDCGSISPRTISSVGVAQARVQMQDRQYPAEGHLNAANAAPFIPASVSSSSTSGGVTVGSNSSTSGKTDYGPYTPSSNHDQLEVGQAQIARKPAGPPQQLTINTSVANNNKAGPTLNDIGTNAATGFNNPFAASSGQFAHVPLQAPWTASGSTAASISPFGQTQSQSIVRLPPQHPMTGPATRKPSTVTFAALDQTANPSPRTRSYTRPDPTNPTSTEPTHQPRTLSLATSATAVSPQTLSGSTEDTGTGPNFAPSSYTDSWSSAELISGSTAIGGDDDPFATIPEAATVARKRVRTVPDIGPDVARIRGGIEKGGDFGPVGSKSARTSVSGVGSGGGGGNGWMYGQGYGYGHGYSSAYGLDAATKTPNTGPTSGGHRDTTKQRAQSTPFANTHSTTNTPPRSDISAAGIRTDNGYVYGTDVRIGVARELWDGMKK